MNRRDDDALVLVVDDDPLSCHLITLVLGAFDTHCVGDAEGALRCIARKKPALLLVDLRLPGMNGLELVRQLRGDPATRDLVILAMTAWATSRTREDAALAGFDGFLTKPIDTRAMPYIVEELLKGNLGVLAEPVAGPAALTGFAPGARARVSATGRG